TKEQQSDNTEQAGKTAMPTDRRKSTHWVDGNTHRKDKPDNSKESDTGETVRFLAVLCVFNTTTRLGPYDMIEYPQSRHTGLMKYTHRKDNSSFLWTFI
ncbi:16537_t:CDS:1, partial [Cetraspora pellucida]